MTARYALPCAGLLAFAGACATTSQQSSESPNPTTREVASSQQATEQALKQAQEAQKQASAQSKKAAEAQARVRQEQAKAQQLQAQAGQEAQQSAQQAQQHQQRAATALSEQTQETAKGRQSAAGVITRVRPDEVVLQPQSGEAMRFTVNDSTKVQIEGRTSTADEIREGQEARVSYEPSVNGPTAVMIRVREAGTATGSGTGSTGAAPGPQEPPSQPAPSAPSQPAPSAPSQQGPTGPSY